MAGDTECGMTETKKVINPRVEIDTSPPFESVKEAVDHFGGGGPWIPHHLLPLATQQNDSEISDINKVEKQAAQLEKDLIMKEQETLNVLKEVEAAKRFVEGIKLSFIQEMSALMATPDHGRHQGGSGQNSACPSVSPGLISMELNHAKLSLNKTTTNLAAIRASVESLNHKMRDETEKGSSKNTDFGKLMPAQEDYRSFQIMNNVPESPMLNFEAEQFKKMTEASRYEVMKAMSEIERTKTSIKMAEMRLTAARKMEEAAKAVEAIALLEMDNSENSMHHQHMFFQNPGGNGITLSIEEYNSLTHRAHQAEELCKTKFIDRFDTNDERNQSEVTIVKNMEETTNRRSKKSLEEALVHEDEYDRRNNVRNSSGRFRFRNSSSNHRRADPINAEESNEANEKVYRSTISIGDILSRKLILQDDSVEGNAERQAEVSLSQMLREQSGLIMHHPSVKPAKEASLDKQFYTQRKKFGFIHVTFPRHSKKKSQFL